MNETAERLPLIAKKRIKNNTTNCSKKSIKNNTAFCSSWDKASFIFIFSGLHVEETPRSKIKLKGTKEREKNR